MKRHADWRSRARVSVIQVGDTVLIHQRKQNKWSTKFNPVPFHVVRCKGTMITASRKWKVIWKCLSFQKDKFSSTPTEQSVTSDDDDDMRISPEGTIESGPRNDSPSPP